MCVCACACACACACVCVIQQVTVIKDQLSMKFLVDNEEALVDDSADEFDVIAPIYVGGVPRGFVAPTDTLVCNICKLRLAVLTGY